MSKLSKRVKKLEAQVSRKLVSDAIPTVNQLWCERLINVAGSVVERYWKRVARGDERTEEYDHFWLYAHQDILKTKSDVHKVSDDVLLEALGLSNVAGWGWLLFMVREFNWFCLVAYNWGHPSIRGEYGGPRDVKLANEEERRAQAALYFVDLMRERGWDPLAELREMAQAFKEKAGISEEVFLEILRKKNEWSYFVYTCESVTIRPEARWLGGPVLYDGAMRKDR